MKKKIILSNIVLIGLVSLFIDMSTEMVYPLIPLFLTSALGVTPAVIGIIEGIAESVASLLKVLSGYIGDVWTCQPFVDTKLRGNYEFCFSNWDGERYPNEECILFVL